LAKTLEFTDTSAQTVKIGDTTTSFTMVLGEDSNPVDLTNATSIIAKLGNNSGYLKSQTIPTSSITDPLSGQIVISFDSNFMSGLPAGSYLLEVWVTYSTGVSIYPSNTMTGFMINSNIEDSGGSTITTITFDDFVKKLNKVASTIGDGVITPEKTNFVELSNYNVLDNSTCLQNTYWVRDWKTATLKRLSGSSMFTFAPIYIKQGQTAYTTNIRTSASFMLDGTWDKDTQVYTGTWKTVQTFLNADEFQECKIVADKDYILFLTCPNAYSTPETAMCVIGDGLPSSFKPFMQGELTIPELVIKPKYLTVNPKEKGCYKTINSAIADAVDGDVIIVYPSSYIEHVKVTDKRIHIIGIDKETCILKTQTGDYLEAHLEIAKGTVSNMTIYSEKPAGLTPPEKTSYGVHIDRLESVGETLTFNNCILKSDFNAGAGIGLRKDFNLTFKNCEFITTEPTNINGACFFHDSNNSTAYGKGKITFDK